MRRMWMLMVVGFGLAAAGCGDEGKAVSPTAPEFKQPPQKQGGKQAGVQ